MNILTIPHTGGGLSHLIPLYVLHQKYLRNSIGIDNYFIVDKSSKDFFKLQGIQCVPIDYSLDEFVTIDNDSILFQNYVENLQETAYKFVSPSLIIEDSAYLSPLIAEKNKIPRISIQRIGAFRSINERYRNQKHRHSSQKKDDNRHEHFDENSIQLLRQYSNSKVKIIPGIETIECLTDKIECRDSYFYSGPLTIKDKPSKSLSIVLDDFLNHNSKKPIVFITTGTIDRTPIGNFIEFFVKRNYAVITTCDCEINERYNQEIFYKKLLPLNHICAISDLVIHQCGSAMYHYPIMNRVPALTIGTLCYDREDVAQRLQELGVAGHIPHPDDNSNYWDIFLELVNKFESNTLIDFDMLDKLKIEIDETSSNFKMENVIEYALS